MYENKGSSYYELLIFDVKFMYPAFYWLFN